MNGRQKAYEEKLDAQLRDLGEQIALLRAMAEKDKANLSIEYNKIVNSMQSRQIEGMASLDQFNTEDDQEKGGTNHG